jgi:PAS domain S-box-containing protein
METSQSRAVAEEEATNGAPGNNILLKAINKLLWQALVSESEVALTKLCLSIAEELTGSAFGFIGELNQYGQFDIIALSDPGWTACRMPETRAAVLLRGMEIRGIWSKPIRQERSVAVNDPWSDPDQVGFPEDHPQITCFLGAPLKHLGKITGLIGLANRIEGYDEKNVADIEALANVFSEVLYHKRKDEIAERRQVPEALIQSEQRYGQLLAAVHSYTYSVECNNGAFTPTKHGQGCVATTGYSPEDYALDPYLWFRMVHPEDRDVVQRYFAKVLAGERVRPLEHRIHHRSGRIRWIRDTIVPSYDLNGRLVRYDGMIEDITERKEAEDALRQNQAKLYAAKRVQKRLLPHASPRLEGYDIAGASIPCEMVGGDFFDFIPMFDESIGIVIGDSSGHSLAAALLSAEVRATLRALVQTYRGVGEILTLANRALSAGIPEDCFSTLLFVRLEPKARILVYSSAGHPPLRIFDAAGKPRQEYPSMGLPLGVDENHTYSSSGAIPLNQGDSVVLYSDGVFEALSPDFEIFGTNRIVESVQKHVDQPASEVIARLHRKVAAHCQSKLSDDITTVVIKVVG